MRFACDAKLGRLARWLRAAGLDVYWDSDAKRSDLIRVAKSESRTILTMSKTFNQLKDIPNYLLIESENLDEQLTQIKQAFPRIEFSFFSRCIVCNHELEKIDKEKFKDKIPKNSLVIERQFYRCPDCGRIYWPGSHVLRMKKRLGKIFEA